MPLRALFSQQFDDATAVARARRSPGPTTAATTPFCYPELDATPRPAEPEPSAATFSEDELARAVEAARQEAAAAAEATVRAEMTARLEHRQAEAHSTIAAQLSAAAAALEQSLAARAAASRELALAIGRALAARALELQPLADIEAILRDLVLRLEGQPWLEVDLPPELLASGEAALAQVAAKAGYRGELRVLPGAALGPGAARVRWQDGAAERDLARIEAEATALVAAWLPDDHHQAPAAPARHEPAREEETER
jgi:flagellar biosynthesis/type III secretory pathway protein FliH